MFGFKGIAVRKGAFPVICDISGFCGLIRGKWPCIRGLFRGVKALVERALTLAARKRVTRIQTPLPLLNCPGGIAYLRRKARTKAASLL
ncbi:MAG: hypothetical protein RL367_208 [Pseudomonadota bacterium]